MEHQGRIQIKLQDLIEKEGITKNELCQNARMERTQVNRFCKNEITRLDTDVLARICTALHCEIQELLEYVPDEE